MRKKTTLALAVATPLLIGGWALFRPELLFIDQKVDAKLVTASAKTERVAQGDFISFAHETTGGAEILRSGGKAYLRLSNFKTSNGPDVHVYLVKGSDPSGEGVKKGFLDLGSIKGNIGDQDYELPANVDLANYGAVAVWCKRFSVGFGGATLAAGQTAQLVTGFRNVSFTASNEIRVTGGTFMPDAGKAKGKADLVEKDGRRYLRLTGAKGPAGVHVLLIKAETIRGSQAISKAEKVDLGVVPTNGNALLPVSKELDAWLYRTVSLWSAKERKSLAVAELRSDQERSHGLLLA